MSDDRVVCRHVHRQHHGLHRRGPRAVAAGLGLGAGGGPPSRRLRLCLGHGGAEPHAPQHPAPRHPDQGGLRERHRRDHGPGWLDQRRAAPLAIAYEAQVELELDDFNKVAARVPHLADTKPHGKYHMLDIDRVGGVPVVMAMLAEPGLFHLDEITVTGNTVGKNLELINPPAPDGEVIHTFDDPIHDLGGIAVLTGSLAPKGSVVKVAGHRLRGVRGTGQGLRRGGQRPWRRCSPVASTPVTWSSSATRAPRVVPGMREMLAITGAMKGAGRGGDCRPDHRRPVLGRDPRVLHRPRRPRGGRRRSDRVRRGGRPHPHRRARPTRSTCWSTRPTLAGERPTGRCRSPATPAGVLAKYAALAQGAEKGAITQP